MSRPSTLPIPELSQNDSPFWILQFPAVLIAYKLFSLLAEKPLTISSPLFLRICRLGDEQFASRAGSHLFNTHFGRGIFNNTARAYASRLPLAT
jgi:hypothetical protein